MDVSENRGTQQPWVFLLKMIILGCFGGTTISGNTLMKICRVENRILPKNSGFAVGAAVSAQERLGMEGAAERVPDVQDIRRGEVFVKDQIRLLKILNNNEKQSNRMRIPNYQ